MQPYRRPSSARRSRSSRRCAYALTSGRQVHLVGVRLGRRPAHTCSDDVAPNAPPAVRRARADRRRGRADSRRGRPAGWARRNRPGPRPGPARTAARPAGPPSRAARSGGWSCSRRSEVNRTTETLMGTPPYQVPHPSLPRGGPVRMRRGRFSSAGGAGRNGGVRAVAPARRSGCVPSVRTPRAGPVRPAVPSPPCGAGASAGPGWSHRRSAGGRGRPAVPAGRRSR